MDARLATCVGCGTESRFVDITVASGSCPTCGGQQFEIPIRHVDDVAEFAQLGLISVESHLCLTWARIALDAAGRAVVASATNADVEFGESLLACTAAAHAIDAFYGGFSRLVTKPDRVSGDTARNGVILETAKAAFAIGRHTRGFAEELQWLYRLRDDAVHFGEGQRPPVVHHSGTVTAAPMAKWSWPSAHRAVAFMLAFMSRCVESPKHGRELKLWTKSIAPILGSFCEQWDAAEVGRR